MIGRLRRGAAAETRAERWLAGQGLRRHDRNVRCRLGEIDLIMRDGDTFVMIEVRQRSSASFGDAAATVTRHKQRRLIAATRWWLSHNPEHAAAPIRFDVVAIDGGPAEERIQWIKAAFDAE
ncbi:YraN family protein [uncultured Abyssibacter sp.]|uniref:YraN family protein n=1 Tax=uncultured Abyssibacter sp. TaxID=2320202 RepID=UPI0032B2BF3F